MDRAGFDREVMVFWEIADECAIQKRAAVEAARDRDRWQAEEKKVGFFAKMKNKVTTKMPKELEIPECSEYVRLKK